MTIKIIKEILKLISMLKRIKTISMYYIREDNKITSLVNKVNTILNKIKIQNMNYGV